jgi:non-specific protein-tyrosine kinase
MTDFIDLQHLASIILRRGWVLAATIILGVMAGQLISQTQTPVYEATTTVLVGQIFQSSNIDRQEILTSELVAQTYSDMIRRQPVLQSVVENLHLDLTWQQLRKRVSVELVEGTQLIQITVEANSPSEAKKIADEVARQMIQFTPTESDAEESEAIRQFVKQQLESLQSRIESGQNELARLQSSMARAGSEEQLIELQAEASTQESLLTNWENSYIQLLGFLQTGQSANTLTIIETAQADPGPVNPQVQFFVFLGGVLGAFLGIGLVFLLEYLDDTYKTPEEIARGLGFPLLSNIPSPRKPSELSNGVFVARYPRSSIAEAYRLLRANLERIGADRPLKTIMITSCDRGVGKSSISTNLAFTLAQSEQGTTLLDADLRNPALHFFLDLNNDLGLSSILRNRMEIDEVTWGYDGLECTVITGGPSPDNPSELIGSRKMDQTLASVKETSDIVLIDSSPLNVSDAILLSAKVDGIVLVVRVGKTRKKLVRRTLEQLNRAEVSVIGVVVTGAKGKGVKDYGVDRRSKDVQSESSARFKAVRKPRTAGRALPAPVPFEDVSGPPLPAGDFESNGSPGSGANGDRAKDDRWSEELFWADELSRPAELAWRAGFYPPEGGPDNGHHIAAIPPKPTQANGSKRNGVNGNRAGEHAGAEALAGAEGPARPEEPAEAGEAGPGKDEPPPGRLLDETPPKITKASKSKRSGGNGNRNRTNTGAKKPASDGQPASPGINSPPEGGPDNGNLLNEAPRKPSKPGRSPRRGLKKSSPQAGAESHPDSSASE